MLKLPAKRSLGLKSNFDLVRRKKPDEQLLTLGAARISCQEIPLGKYARAAHHDFLSHFLACSSSCFEQAGSLEALNSPEHRMPLEIPAEPGAAW